MASVTESGKEAMRFVDEDAVVALIAKEGMFDRRVDEIRCLL